MNDQRTTRRKSPSINVYSPIVDSASNTEEKSHNDGRIAEFPVSLPNRDVELFAGIEENRKAINPELIFAMYKFVRKRGSLNSVVTNKPPGTAHFDMQPAIAHGDALCWLASHRNVNAEKIFTLHERNLADPSRRNGGCRRKILIWGKTPN
ncbi:MAG TPA: hypothetical protein VHV31_14480 [Nitrolancea sp.]|nr:hypothetical protein [Nitrolancea sp.]